MDIRMYEYPLAILQEGSLSLAARRLEFPNPPSATFCPPWNASWDTPFLNAPPATSPPPPPAGTTF